MSDLQSLVSKEISRMDFQGFSKVTINYRLSNSSLTPRIQFHEQIKRSFPRDPSSPYLAEVEVFDKIEHDPQETQNNSVAQKKIPLVIQVSIFKEDNKVSEVALTKEVSPTELSEQKKPQ
ncbi:MAG: hypothetical protein LW875_02785 [Proteobacteria bacterium]|nr:hypothetical protein [Pseudomonadota bacterium]